ncbi:MAG TPA: pantoate--beta-alanine ligase [Bacteroidales bacterium]|nr:pantoate--beta-alanine ligase [Bacteroidales bacterium]HPI85506.1 pantoate--beta-alanine ligase [Bacteroidales bacterium]HPM92622.1 pantoate--beta-alanine ligase [Bacteroidales bacterium]
MKIFHTISETRAWLDEQKAAGKSSGFVPTMGALHRGHTELIRRSVSENNITGCSIFVNPIQFNNPEDLEKYPRTLETDVAMLEEAGCDLVFVPSVKEMYPEPVTEKYHFGPLEQVMEGAHRPGHFNGVAVVVKKLFDIFQPDRAYFGEKDYQQLAIIRALVKMKNIPVGIVPCPTVREADGLAMSSRNRRLTPEERAIAPEIYRTLDLAADLAGIKSVAEVKQLACDRLTEKGFVVDYFEISDAVTLQPVDAWDQAPEIIGCVAAFLGNVRLIDNLILFRNFAG